MRIEQAKDIAGELLAEILPRRWNHVQGVGTWAEKVSEHIPGSVGVLPAAAWLHDIGYAPLLVDTGFHPIDGARHLRRLGVDERIVCLVAHHTCAHIEADLRGLSGILRDEFSHERSDVADALCFCDMTTSPDGDRVEVLARLTEIRSRYGPGDLVTQFIDIAEPEILATAERISGLLAETHPM
ncbi:HD domain-containing protein [Actinocorallia aurantiaca]|uniref:HD domain-containing protein n=1 Tax=Actinocorallia aurantiaca TaxID=46204 RepID=A0ABN3UUZ7_9ACTN